MWTIPGAGIVTSSFLIRPRSATNSDELTPVVLLSGIVSGTCVEPFVWTAPAPPVGITSGSVCVPALELIVRVAPTSAPQVAALASPT